MVELFITIIIVLLHIVLYLLYSKLYPIQNNTEKDINEDKTQLNKSSIIGASTTLLLEHKSKADELRRSPVVPLKELNNVFETELYNADEISHEYAINDNSHLDNEAPIYFNEDKNTPDENIELQKRVCLDYYQIESASHSVARGVSFTDEDKEALHKLDGTLLLNAILDNVDNEILNKTVNMLKIDSG